MRFRLFILVAWTFYSNLNSQSFFYAGDSLSFEVISIGDTVGFSSEYTDSLEIDLDLDGVRDIRLVTYSTPVPNFPGRQHIDIQNLDGRLLKFLNGNNVLIAYGANLKISLDTLTDWEGSIQWKVMSYFPPTGPCWPNSSGGCSWTPPENMYLLFKYSKYGETKFGWINFSGRHSNIDTWMYVQKIGVLSEGLITNSTETFDENNRNLKIYPNPFQNSITIEVVGKEFNGKKTYSLFDAVGRMIEKGAFVENIYNLHWNGNLSSGIYHILIRNKNGACMMRRLMKS